jgi:hypothetical protein
MIALLLALQATTICSQGLGGTINCTTNEQPNFTYQPPPDYYGQVMQGVERQQQVQAQQQNALAAAMAGERAKTVGKMLAKGDCAGALGYALRAGDFALADRVKGYCGGK